MIWPCLTWQYFLLLWGNSHLIFDIWYLEGTSIERIWNKKADLHFGEKARLNSLKRKVWHLRIGKGIFRKTYLKRLDQICAWFQVMFIPFLTSILRISLILVYRFFLFELDILHACQWSIYYTQFEKSLLHSIFKYQWWFRIYEITQIYAAQSDWS